MLNQAATLNGDISMTVINVVLLCEELRHHSQAE